MNATTTATAIATIEALNLDAIKTKLMHRASGEGWSAAHAHAVEIEYRRFLTLMKLYPNDANAPTVDVDTFWHYHILDTAKYAADCAAAFGYFLHHYPYLGMDDADEADRSVAGARTQELYAATFGASPQAAPADAAWCGAGTAKPAAATFAWCGAAAGQKLAWCGAGTASGQLAWCGASSAPKQLAWCGAAPGAPANDQLAWCGASTSATAQPALAWCGAATARRLQVTDDIALTVAQ